MSRAFRILGALGCLALATVAVARYQADRARRVAIEQFAAAYAVERRRPDDAEALRKAPTFEFAADSVARVATDDAAGGVDLSSLDPETRALWLDVVADLDRELETASTLLLRAIPFRPGWAYNYGFLGLAEYQLARRGARLGEAPERWLLPFQTAAATAPGERWPSVWAGYAAIDAWPLLSPDVQQRSIPLIAQAFGDPRFVEDALLDVIGSIGHDRAFSLLPASAASLRAAVSVEADAGHTEAAASLFRRWESSEWNERARDLAEIEARVRLADRSGALRLSRLWMSRHDVFAFDTPQGQAQAARLLALWPAEPGEWKRDPRTRLVTYLLDRPVGTSGGESLAATASLLAGMPAGLRARALVLGGDLYAAESIVRDSGGGTGFEWTRYLVQLIHHQLREKDVAGARETLRRVAPAALDECEVAVAVQAIEAAEGSAMVLPLATAPLSYRETMWANRRLPVCIDPLRKNPALAVDFRVEEPALVSFGFDDGRLGTALMNRGGVRITVPLDANGGRRVFHYSLLAGGPATARTAHF